VIDIQNLGDDVANNVSVTDTYDLLFTTITNIVQSTGTYTQTGSMFTWDVGDLDPGMNATITFDLEI
jgi:hypothetical protein